MSGIPGMEGVGSFLLIDPGSRQYASQNITIGIGGRFHHK
jgi:hypothetical protein